MALENLPITTGGLWATCGVLALAETWIFLFLSGWISRSAYRSLRPWLIATAFVFWYIFWNGILRLLNINFPQWVVELSPLWAALEALLAVLLWWSGLRFEKHSTTVFGLLGGFSGLLTTVWLVNNLGQSYVISKIPFFLFAFFSSLLIWCVILLIAHTLYKTWNVFVHNE